MVLHDTQKSNPELFDCPFTAASVEQYTFKEVRQQYGEGFRDKFWPVFQVCHGARRARLPRLQIARMMTRASLPPATQAFNCVLPCHAPEEEVEGQSAANALASFLPPGR